MKKHFADPIADKHQKPEPFKKEGPWECRNPEYDERSSCFKNTGTYHGVGHKNPVGHKNGAKQFVATMPMKAETIMVKDQ